MTPAQNIGLSIVFILAVSVALTSQNSYAITYAIKVTFDSITVHDDHDGTFAGDGEWLLDAIVQGKGVNLLGTATRDVGDGESVVFSPGTAEVSVEVPHPRPLSIFTIGGEDDFTGLRPCFESGTTGTGQRYDIVPILDGPSSDWLDEINAIQRDWQKDHDRTGCFSQDLGLINEIYSSSDYGAGPHQVKSQKGDFTLKYTIGVSKTVNIGPLAPEPLQRVCNNNLPITSVTASGDDGNVPQNVLDDNLGTRWSSNGVGQFITADLGSTKNICGVDIAWFRGDERMYGFQISASSDGSTFTKLLTTSSSGTTLNSEKYIIPPTDARYVRVTVTGNTVNNFASITELDIFG